MIKPNLPVHDRLYLGAKSRGKRKPAADLNETFSPKINERSRMIVEAKAQMTERPPTEIFISKNFDDSNKAPRRTEYEDIRRQPQHQARAHQQNENLKRNPSTPSFDQPNPNYQTGTSFTSPNGNKNPAVAMITTVALTPPTSSLERPNSVSQENYFAVTRPLPEDTKISQLFQKPHHLQTTSKDHPSDLAKVQAELSYPNALPSAQKSLTQSGLTSPLVNTLYQQYPPSRQSFNPPAVDIEEQNDRRNRVLAELEKQLRREIMESERIEKIREADAELKRIGKVGAGVEDNMPRGRDGQRSSVVFKDLDGMVEIEKDIMLAEMSHGDSSRTPQSYMNPSVKQPHLTPRGTNNELSNSAFVPRRSNPDTSLQPSISGFTNHRKESRELSAPVAVGREDESADFYDPGLQNQIPTVDDQSIEIQVVDQEENVASVNNIVDMQNQNSFAAQSEVTQEPLSYLPPYSIEVTVEYHEITVECFDNKLKDKQNNDNSRPEEFTLQGGRAEGNLETEEDPEISDTKEEAHGNLQFGRSSEVRRSSLVNLDRRENKDDYPVTQQVLVIHAVQNIQIHPIEILHEESLDYSFSQITPVARRDKVGDYHPKYVVFDAEDGNKDVEEKSARRTSPENEKTRRSLNVKPVPLQALPRSTTPKSNIRSIFSELYTT